MNSRPSVVVSLASLLLVLTFVSSESAAPGQRRARRRQPPNRICFNPQERCRTAATFEPHDLPFSLPQNAVIWDSEPFYAVVLKSLRVRDDDYQSFIPEDERLRAQALFPDRKVFADRYPEAGTLSYEGFALNRRLLAVYAGTTRAEALQMLRRVQATGMFPGANIRRTRAAFNGT